MTPTASRSFREILDLRTVWEIRARRDRSTRSDPIGALSFFLLLFTLLLPFVGCGGDNGTEPTPPANQWSALGSGFSHPARALATFREELIAGGRFLQAGDSTVNGIARWDGSVWRGVGSGFGPTGSSELVYSLVVHDGDLIAGGEFMEAGGDPAKNIASWDGSAWSPLGAGTEGPVFALADYEGGLVAGGSFEIAGGGAAPAVALWDGTNWAPIGGGMSRRGESATVGAVSIFRGDLIAGGEFDRAGENPASNIARWDGTAWGPLAAGIDGEVRTLAVWNDRLIAGGEFTHAGGVAANRVAQWDGTAWQPLGSGITVSLEGFPTPGVACLSPFESSLFAGGYFQKAGGGWANCIARWDGATWSALGGTDLPVLSLAVHDGALILAGGFDWAGGVTAHRVARWGP